MKKNILCAAIGAAICLGTVTSCSKSDDSINNSNTSFAELQSKTLSDFVSIVALPTYADFLTKATTLKQAVTDLAADPSAAKQTAARDAWRATRVVWEQSEGFLIGPVEDDEYDPYMDTWPTDKNTLNALITGNQPAELNVDYLESENSEAQLTLRGFHPLEYLLWDTDGNRDPATYTAREKQYMVALATDIYNNVVKLNKSWTDDKFGDNLISAGKDGSKYLSQQDALTTIANALIDICGEVGDSKMKEPFDSQDSTQSESPYSHNSVADFRNNLTGALYVYTCKNAAASGTSLSDLVAANNKSLDADIKAQFNNAINSFDGFNDFTFENAVIHQRPTVQNTLDKIAALQTTLNDKLIPYLQQYVKN